MRTSDPLGDRTLRRVPASASGDVCVVRTLAMDAGVIGDVLARLGRDTIGAYTHWNLGERGTAALDLDFVRAPAGASAEGPTWRTTARLWHPAGVALEQVGVQLRPTSAGTCELRLEVQAPLSRWWSEHRSALLDLALATADELIEELRWYATRAAGAVTAS